MDAARPLVLYVRDGCHLCDQFLVDLALELGGQTAGLTVHDVDADAELAARYGLRVPVLECAGQVASEGRFDRVRFRELYPL